MKQQPKEYCKMDIGWKIGKCTSRELFFKSKGNGNEFKYALVGHRDCIAYSSISCCYVSTKHIAYFLSFFFCLFSLFLYLYVGVPWP